MKPIRSLLMLASILSVASLYAQKPILVYEDSLSFASSKFPAVTVTIPEVNYERTMKNWMKEQQERTKSKVLVENSEMSIFGAQLKNIENPVNIYSKLINQDSLLLLSVSIELKKDQYVEKATGDVEFTTFRTYLKEFAKTQYADFVKDELQVEEKKLKDLENELDGLKSDKTKMEKSIQSNRTAITEEGDNITLQNSEITRINTEISEQNNVLNAMEAGAAREEKSSYVKDLDKRKRKMLNSIESSENKISKAKSEISDAEKAIPENEDKQQVVMEKIRQQEAVVQKFADKLGKVEAY